MKDVIELLCALVMVFALIIFLHAVVSNAFVPWTVFETIYHYSGMIAIIFIIALIIGLVCALYRRTVTHAEIL